MAKDFREWPETQTTGNRRGNGSRFFDFPPAVTDEGSANGERSIVDAMPDAVQQNRSFVYRHRRELVSAAVVVAVAAIVSGTVLGVRHRVDGQETLSSCQQSVEIYQSNVQRLRKTVKEASQALSITEEQVQDGDTVKKLKKAVADAENNKKVTLKCDASASAGENQASDAALTEATQTLGSNVESVLSAQSAVTKSKTDRDVAVAKADLSNKVLEGQNVMASSQSSNLTVRQDLSAMLNEAQQIAVASSNDPSLYTNELNKLQSAIDKYNSTATQQ